jgi:hypothetical protein
MTVPPQNPGRWSHHRWRRTFLGLFALQLVFVWFLSDRLPEPKKAPSHLGKLSLMADVDAKAPLALTMGLMDPTIFAFASPNGFSGKAWFNPRLPSHKLEDKAIPFQPLAADPVFFGKAEALIPKTGLLASLQSSEKSEPRLMEIALTQPPIWPQSALHVEGPIGQRLNPIKEVLPAWTNQDMLTNTTVQIVVDASGNVLSTRLGPGCGLAKADEFAAIHARGLQFQPIASAREGGADMPARLPLAWGTLVYRWATIPSVVTTNQKAAP